MFENITHIAYSCQKEIIRKATFECKLNVDENSTRALRSNTGTECMQSFLLSSRYGIGYWKWLYERYEACDECSECYSTEGELFRAMLERISYYAEWHVWRSSILSEQCRRRFARTVHIPVYRKLMCCSSAELRWFERIGKLIITMF